LDQRNHGRSFWDEEFNYKTLSIDLLNYIDYYKIKNPIVLGHSMGGKTAMQFAFDFPEKIKKLIVVDIVPKKYKQSHIDILKGLSVLDFNELNSKIESLEKKINSLDYFFQNKTEVTQVDQSLDGELSIFHQLDNQSPIKQNKSLLVLESENINYKSKFKLFHFIMTINFLFLILIGLIIYIKNIPIKEVLNIF